MKKILIILLVTFLPFLVSTSAYSALSASWQFEGGGNNFIDSTGNNNVAIPAEQPGIPARSKGEDLYGNALYFDGDDTAIVEGSSNITLTGDFTLSARIKVADYNAQYTILFKHDNNEGPKPIYRLSVLTTGYLQLSLRNIDGQIQNYTSSFPVSEDSWVHVTVTRNLIDKKIKWYKNGTPVGLEKPDTTGSLPDSTGRLLLGSEGGKEIGAGTYDYVGKRGFKGSIDDVRIHDSLLLDDDIIDLTLPTTKVLSFNMDDPIESTIVDDQTNYQNDGDFGTDSFSPTRVVGDINHGYALQFSGDDYVTVPDDPGISDLPAGLTLSAYINYNTSANNSILYKTEYGMTFAYRLNVQPDGFLNLSIHDGDSSKNFRGYIVNPGEWTKVSVSIDMDAHKIVWYKGDDEFISAHFFTEKSSITKSTGPLLVGARNIRGFDGFNGFIDDVEINNSPIIKNPVNFEEFNLTIDETGHDKPVIVGSIDTFSYTIHNPTETPQTYSILVTDRQLLGNETPTPPTLIKDVVLGPDQSRVMTESIDTSKPGSHRITIEVMTKFFPQTTVAKETTLINVWNPVGNTFFDNVENFFGISSSFGNNDNLPQISGGAYDTTILDADTAIISDMGVKVARFLLRWSELEHAQYDFDWGKWDLVINALNHNDINPLPFLFVTPIDWAIDESAKTAAETALGRQVLNSPPKHFSYYFDTMSTLAQRYNSSHVDPGFRVPFWLILNEPYLGIHWWYSENADQKYVELLQGAYGAIKDTDPYSQVIMGGQSPGPRTFSDKVVELGKGFYDIYSYHSHGSVNRHLAALDVNTTRLKDFDEDKLDGWWSDETGFAIDVNDDIGQAIALIKKGTISRHAGLKNFTWHIFRHQSDNTGITKESVDGHGGLRSTVVAYNAMATLLQDVVPHAELAQISDSTDADNYGYSFYRNGEQVLVMWNEKDEENLVNISLPSGTTSVKRFNIFGAETTVSVSGNNLPVTLGFEPAIFVLPAVTLQSEYISIAEHDGYVVESGEETGIGGDSDSGNKGKSALRLGDGPNNEQYKSIVSFDTSNLPANAIVVAARIELIRSDTDGEDPFAATSTFDQTNVDLSIEGFGGNTVLENSDFEAAADVTNIAQFVDDGATGYARLNSSGLKAIKTANSLQLRIEFRNDDNNNFTEDRVSYYSGNVGRSSTRPRLIVDYVLP